MLCIGRYFLTRTAEIKNSIITRPYIAFSLYLKMSKVIIFCGLIILPSGDFGDSARLLGSKNSPENSLPRDASVEASEDCPPGWFQTSLGCYMFLDIKVIGPMKMGHYQYVNQGPI